MIEVSKLKKNYGEWKVFDDISFHLGDNEGLFLEGASGCGKTTLLRILAGFDTDFDGDLIIDRIRISKDILPNKRNIAIVFQDSTLWNHMTIEKNMSYGMQKYDREMLMFVAKGLKIENLLHKYPEEISGGQAKRVSLARALLSGKNNLLLDEPLSNVDLKTKEIIMEFLKENYLGNRCILYVTHDRDEIERLPFKVIEMKA